MYFSFKGNEKEMFNSRIKNKKIFGVGVNDFSKGVQNSDGKIIWQYRLWSNILYRCYKEDKCLGYRNNTIDEKWLSFNCFYNDINKISFNERYETHNYQVDKDILSKGLHHYSKDTICFIPQQINKILTLRTNARGQYKLGVSLDKKSNKFRSQINKNGKRFVIGFYDNQEDAYMAYCTEKNMYIGEIANQYKTDIDIKVYNRLIHFDINEYITNFNR